MASGPLLGPVVAAREGLTVRVRRRFLLQCLEDLDARLRKLNSRLFVIRGQPADVFPKLIKVRALSFF